MTINEKIDNIDLSIFDYEINNVSNNVISVFTEIIETGLINKNSNEDMKSFNEYMNICLSAMQKKDYLLLADCLEYNIKPMIGG